MRINGHVHGVERKSPPGPIIYSMYILEREASYGALCINLRVASSKEGFEKTGERKMERVEGGISHL